MGVGLTQWEYVMSWDTEFAEPIDLPNKLVATTLRQVIGYIHQLPDAEQNSQNGSTPANVSFKLRIRSDLFGSRASRLCRPFNDTGKK